MNIKILLLILLVSALSNTSCESEYSERMCKAIVLKKKHEELKSTNKRNLKEVLNDIEQEIKNHATLSGNEELFLKEIWENKR
jgi:hypothetical protein